MRLLFDAVTLLSSDAALTAYGGPLPDARV